MPLRILIKATVSVLLGIVVVAQRAEAQALSFSVFERYLDAFRTEAAIPGMSAIFLQNGIVVWERGFGRSDLESGTLATPDTPYLIGGLSQPFGAALLLRKCVDQWGALLEDAVALRHSSYPEPQTTLLHLLAHAAPGGGAYQYSASRFAALTPVIERCAQRPYRATLVSEILDRFGMAGSAPDQTLSSPSPDDRVLFDQFHLDRYADVISRLAAPYRMVSGRAQRNTELPSEPVDAASGIISSARDLARFDAALSSTAILAATTRNQSWTQVVLSGIPFPTGLGWFVQNYRDEPIVWQFGTIHGGHSGLIIKAPNRGLTLILLANSDRMNAPFNLEAGDVTSSIFASLFLRFFVP